uniref:Uncharacterized protein n=1 Tax=Rhizophora mucronata TaxID=61149 RepID=A0A2P2J5Q3_RHIMU
MEATLIVQWLTNKLYWRLWPKSLMKGPRKMIHRWEMEQDHFRYKMYFRWIMKIRRM